MNALLTSRVVAKFAWWDDAIGHAQWLAARTGLRYRVYRPTGHVAWRVCAAIRAGGGPMSDAGLVLVETECDGCRRKESLKVSTVVDGQHQLEDLGWLRNHKLDQDLCPECSQARVGFYGIDPRLL